MQHRTTAVHSSTPQTEAGGITPVANARPADTADGCVVYTSTQRGRGLDPAEGLTHCSTNPTIISSNGA